MPRYQEADGFYLAHMTLWFFLLSAMAHGTIAAFNWRQAWAATNLAAREVTGWTGWYYVWIQGQERLCRQPLRWVPHQPLQRLSLIHI